MAAEEEAADGGQGKSRGHAGGREEGKGPLLGGENGRASPGATRAPGADFGRW